MRGGAFVVILAAILSGCAGPAAPGIIASDDEATATPVVIAVIDSGVNPYHETFLSAGSDSWAPPGSAAVSLSAAGNLEERVRADTEFWAALEPERLVHFEGRSLAAISLGKDNDSAPFVLEAGEIGHGTATAALVLRESPEAYVVLVQVPDTFCSGSTLECPTFPPLSRALAWVAEQTWISAVSISLGIPGNTPMPDSVSPEFDAYVAASRAIWESGKLIINSAGNEVVPPFTRYTGGPPWIITVGGLTPDGTTEDPFSAKSPDFAANYTALAPTAEGVDTYALRRGTSFAAPVVAGTLAEGIRLARAMSPDPGVDLSPSRLRAALNASALPIMTPLGPNTTPLAAAQAGWGRVDASVAAEVARRMIEEDFEVPQEKSFVASYQAAAYTLREQYWNRGGIGLPVHLDRA